MFCCCVVVALCVAGFTPPAALAALGVGERPFLTDSSISAMLSREVGVGECDRARLMLQRNAKGPTC